MNESNQMLVVRMIVSIARRQLVTRKKSGKVGVVG
jgi:hypothetical protein